MTDLEKMPGKSPLLGRPIIERDYTQGIESQIKEPVSPGPEPEPGPAPEPSPHIHHDFGPDDTKSFHFEQPADGIDGSDAEDGGIPGFELAGTSAKAFANTLGDLIKIYFPLITYSRVAADMNSIKLHVSNGNMNASMVEAFLQVNEETLKALQFEEDEIKMWKKACKEYLEYKNLQIANPETSFLIASAALIGRQAMTGVQLSKRTQQYMRDAIMSYNPDFFNSYSAKSGEEPKKDESKEEPKKEI